MFDFNALLYEFIIVTLLSLVIGLEQRRHHMDEGEDSDMQFGTDRTFTFIGILGFILYELDTESMVLFLSGGAVISILLAIFYKQKIEKRSDYGFTSILAALITYCLAPLVITQPKWFALLIVVTVLILTEIKSALFNISKKFDKDEFITLAKFLVIAFIILPNLPQRPLSAEVPISLYNMWLALVVVSGISYFSYLLRKFFFRKSGLLLTGILGGLYSSTAVTLLLSKRSNEKSAQPQEYAASIIFATAIMYIRVFLFILIFNAEIAMRISPYLIFYFLLSLTIGYVIHKRSRASSISPEIESEKERNPLEFRIAFLFMVFYFLFSILSHYAEQHFGLGGIYLLSFLAGLADVDSFILNLIQGSVTVSNLFIAIAILLATTSNNLIKLIYGIYFSERKCRRIIIKGFSTIILLNVAGIILLILLR